MEDAAEAHVRACEIPTTKTRVFNVREGEYTNARLVEAVRKVNPQARVNLVDGVSSITRDEDYSVPTMDITGLEEELKWLPEHNLERALRKIFNGFRSEEGIPLL